MKHYNYFFRPIQIQLGPIFLLILFLLAPLPLNADSIVGQSIDALFNLRDQLQDVVMKSVKPVAEAMQDGPAEARDTPFTIGDLESGRAKYARLHALSSKLLSAQQKLLNVDAQILAKLPPGDPRRGEVAGQMKQVGGGISETRASSKNFGSKLAEFNAAIGRWNDKHPDPARDAAIGARDDAQGNRPDPGDSTRESTHSARPECPPEHHHGGKPGC
jgi:hypothetical protein